MTAFRDVISPICQGIVVCRYVIVSGGVTSDIKQVNRYILYYGGCIVCIRIYEGER